MKRVFRGRFWTKESSKRAVAARARKRLASMDFEPLEAIPVKCRIPRRTKPDFIIKIECKTGERTQLSLRRWNKQFITDDGIKSARQISRGIEMLIRKLA